MKNPKPWPVLTTYDLSHLRRIALPLGGIGTGTISLGGRGDLRDFELVNRPAKGFTPRNTFFVLRTKQKGKEPIMRALEGPIDSADYEGKAGCVQSNHGLPRFAQCSFAAAYPLGQVLLSDPQVPLKVRLQAFNPMAPTCVDLSSIPVVVLRYVLTNRSNAPVQATVCGSMSNFIGNDGSAGETDRAGGIGPHPKNKINRNQFRTSQGLAGLFMDSQSLAADHPAWGTMALTTLTNKGVTYRTAWPEMSWGSTRLDFWDDLLADGQLTPFEDPQQPDPTGSLAVSLTIPARSEKSVTFLLTWHFPNRKTWTPKPVPAQPPAAPTPSTAATSAAPSAPATSASACCAPGSGCCPTKDEDVIGNYYTTRYADAWVVSEQTAARLTELERMTVEFVESFCATDLPQPVKEAALFNLSTLRSQTVFRTPDGFLFGWEGCMDKVGCCMGSCTHVWNYESAMAFLFGQLSRGMREVEFLHTVDDRGMMSFRVSLPLSRSLDWKVAAADGQMGVLMRLYRDWKLCGDDQWLAKLWPNAKKAMEFAWITGGWDADRDGVMEGCQHNTMDVEYYGPNPQMTGWYLGALRACEEMARHLGDQEFAGNCRKLFESGSRWMDEHLFNGQYYEHLIQPAKSETHIADGLRHSSMGARNLAEPELQLGAGCLVDQLVGQYMAHLCGLGYLHAPDKVKTTLKSIKQHNFLKSFQGHFNCMRSYVLGDESALLMCTYPLGRRPKSPFPYFSEVMTGFEYTAAVGMIYEGLLKDGLECIKSVRDRYDGWKRSPFNEAECGHHYARALASWSAIIALTGFQYSAHAQAITFAASGKKTVWFWSTGNAWGTFTQSGIGSGNKRRAVQISLKVIGGTLALSKLELSGAGVVELTRPKILKAGQTFATRL